METHRTAGLRLDRGAFPKQRIITAPNLEDTPTAFCAFAIEIERRLVGNSNVGTAGVSPVKRGSEYLACGLGRP
jgi:hypothetical protein